MSRSSLPALLVALILAVSADAGLIHVDHAGGGDYLTISEGVGAASAGDTVVVAPGTYDGSLNRGIGMSGITLMSESGSDVTVVDCENGDYAFQLIGGAVLRGFTITRASGETINGHAAVYGSSSTIADCVFTDNPGTGVLTYGEILITDCVFLDHTGSAARLERTSGTISDCVFANKTGYGLVLYDEWYGDYHPPLYVLDCIFRGNGDAGLVCTYEAPIVEGCIFVDNAANPLRIVSSGAQIRDCTIVSNHSDSYGALHFTLGNHSGGQNLCAIENCIVAFNCCAGSISGAPDQTDFVDNCFFENAGGDSLLTRFLDRSNIFEDPLFCNLAEDDYTLCANSPCLAENEPLGVAMGAYADGPGCGSCSSPINPTSWGAIKALYGPSK